MRIYRIANKKWILQKQSANYVPAKEIIRRFELLGWRVIITGNNERRCFSPDRVQIATIPYHNYELRWMESRGDVIRDNPDLAFIYESVFRIPKDFNFKTQRIEEKITQYYNLTLDSINQVPQDFQTWEFLINKDWRYVEEIDWNDRILMMENGNLIPMPSGKTEIRKMEEAA